MPTLRPDKGNRWMARVVIDGRQIASKMFSSGKEHGPEWRAAKQWEEDTRATHLAGNVTPSGFEILQAWMRGYIEHARRSMCKKTVVEKTMVLVAFSEYCVADGIGSPVEITPARVYGFLATLNDKRGAKVANKHLKNLKAAWGWGVDYVEGFPQAVPPFRKDHRFKEGKTIRYVPSEADVIRVLEQTKGQDLVMLLAMYFTGARRGEIFALTWDDVDLGAGRIRLFDNKGGSGKQRMRWITMHPELVEALTWWHAARPCLVPNVFMQEADYKDAVKGEPFKERRHLMGRLCRKAGVKPFGFHAIRHKSAAITFEASGLNAAQALMGHSRATTTDIYVRSAGLYMDQNAILTALGGSGIGQAVGSLLEKSFPHEIAPHGENCNPEHVTQ